MTNNNYSTETITAYHEIAEAIDTARQEQGLSRASLAQKARVSSATVSSIISRKERYMTSGAIRKVAAVLNISEDIEDNLRIVIGGRLKAKRSTAGTSIRKSGEAVGIRHQRLSEVERGVGKDAETYNAYALSLTGQRGSITI